MALCYAHEIFTNYNKFLVLYSWGVEIALKEKLYEILMKDIF